MAKIYKKTWPDFFEKDRGTVADFRCADFELKEGDEICYREWNPKTKEYSGREYTKVVKAVLKYNSPTKYWSQEKLEKHGLYLMIFE